MADFKGLICLSCKCSPNLKIVRCKGKSLKDFPTNLPWQLERLDLEKNHITNINEDALRNCSCMKDIYLAKNELHHLPEMLFQNLTISKIELHENKLNIPANSKVFFNVRETLTYLTIYRNKNISHEIFEGLAALNVLKIDGNVTGGFGRSFSTLTNLTELKIMKPIGKITNKTFENFAPLTKLHHLDMNNADITDIELMGLAHFKHLNYLDLSMNKNFSLMKTFDPLKFASNKLNNLRLYHLVDDKQTYSSLTKKFYKSLENKKNLTHLFLNKNDILYAEDGFCETFRHLVFLDVTYNRFEKVQCIIKCLFQLVNLTRLFASHQSKRFFGDDQRNHDVDLTFSTSVGHTIVANNTEVCDHSHKCQAENRIRCNFKTFTGTSNIGEQVWCLVVPRNLQQAYLSNIINENFDWLPAVLILGKSSINQIVMHDNGFRIVKGPIIVNSPRNLQPLTVDFGLNFIHCFAPNIFHFSILKRGLIIGALNLEYNELGYQLSKDTKGTTFKLYTNLTELNLSNNKIKKLNKKTFYNLHMLTKLSLSENSLQMIEFEISHMKHLKILNLTHNLLVSIDGSNQMVMISLSTQTFFNFSLSLLGNPLQCTCETIYFMDWVQSEQVMILDKNTTQCQNDLKFITLHNINNEIGNLKFYCNMALPLKIGGSLTGLTIICIFLAVVLHKYRWDIRYYFMRIHQASMYYKSIQESKDKYYVYDAFVSYDVNDRLWVVRDLILNLECPDQALGREPLLDTGLVNNCFVTDDVTVNDNRSHNSNTNSNNYVCGDGTECENTRRDRFENADDRFLLCIHERDFEAGIEIESNIFSAIKKSRKVLLVVTKNFMASRWCRFELEMSRMESLERGRNLVVPVFLEPVQMTLDNLIWLTKRYTYLEWFAYGDDRKAEFWKRLKMALGNEKMEKIVCECGREFFS